MKKFAPFADNILPWLTCLTMTAALAMVFLYVPNEQMQGAPQRIFYFHLPAAWNTFFGFFIVAGASASYLWQGDRFSDLLAQAAAEVGMVFCTLVLITADLGRVVDLGPAPDHGGDSVDDLRRLCAPARARWR
jgi:ABC-type transport system involved in cytochrome c biogenesis permease subunit